MPHSENPARHTGRNKPVADKKRPRNVEPRYTVALAPSVAKQVAHYAQAVDTSMSKAIAALVRLGLDGQENRKQEFFRKLKENLADDDPNQQDRLVDEFRALILGR